MIKIEFPVHPYKIKKIGSKESIFDEVRRRWIVLTPEEWVRQNFLQYIIQTKKYPASLIAVEKELMLGELKKRTDIVVYNKSSKPWMIIECKEMKVKLNEKVLEQILRYHISLPVSFLIMTNGSYCFGFEKVKSEFVELNELPVYS
jgi:hypothetical protein